ncbi:CBS domain-containing protein [Methanopyrus sp. KOL6]|uniref:CBS domain-containing protein n=1 Tax=Methanopyrus sp. KOL6 TaxID=1937004 RepID=UPI000B4AF0D8|nr:CBS domain-containing protein [Methanopyrus sp. KOL6]
MKAEMWATKEYPKVKPEDGLEQAVRELTRYSEYTAVVVNGSDRLVGLVTSNNIARGLTAGAETVEEVCRSPESISPSDPITKAVEILTDSDLTLVPLEEDMRVVGVVTLRTVVELMSNLYDTPARDLLEKIQENVPGISWDEFIEAATMVFNRELNRDLTPEEFERKIGDRTFGYVLWLMGGLENLFIYLFKLGEAVVARKVAKRRRELREM